MKRVPPLKLRRLSATMTLKCLRLHDVEELCGLDASVISRVLNDLERDPEKVTAVRKAITEAPMPKEASHAA